MARTPAGGLLTAQHRQAQLQIRARTVRDFTRLWPLWVGSDQTFRELVEASLPLVRVYHDASARAASAYYQGFRLAERPGGSAAPQLARALDEDRVVASLYATGQTMTRRALLAGQAPQAAMQTALVRASGAVTRHVLNGGRETLIQSTASDRRARGWQRVTGGGKVCAFCAMLAARGAVYGEQAADFQAHDHCTCFAEPAYADSAPPPESQRFRDIYNEATRDARDSGDLERGTSNDLLNAFRRALTA